jgi:DNA polymerase II large subunit
MEGPAATENMKRYFSSLKEEAISAARIAQRARTRGFDPTKEVEIPFADDLAGRVEKLVGPEGVAKRIRELAPKMSREKLLLKIAQETAIEMVDNGIDKETALDQATRTGLAILTEGVLVAPLEGIAEVKLGKNQDGTDYADLYFAGPIRAAGGTAQAVSVLIADQVRISLGIGEFKVTDQEVSRYVEEFQLYKNLQYKPKNEEIERIVRNCPVCVNGEGTEKVEVQGNRDLPRVPTNQVRSGICLVIAEGLLLKAKKILKITKALEIKGWDFLKSLMPKKMEQEAEEENVCNKEELLEQLVSMKDLDTDLAMAIDPADDQDGNYLDFTFDEEESTVQLTDEGMDLKVEAAVKYIKDLIAGRPVFSHPSRPGGFRLRYGRGRTCGLATIGISPYTLFLTESFMAIGTQIKIERPGKAGAVTPVDTVDGPTVLLNNGDLVRVNDEQTMEEVSSRIKCICDMGEILIPFGEFAENNHMLIQGSFSEDWWEREVEISLYQKENGIDMDPFSEAYRLEEMTEEIRKEEMLPFTEMKCRNPPPREEELSILLKKCEENADVKVKSYLKNLSRKARSIDRELGSMDISQYKPENGREAVRISEEIGVPLHPYWTLFWHDISIQEMNRIRNHLLDSGTMKDRELLVPEDTEIKEILIKLNCPHKARGGMYHIGDMTIPLIRCLGITEDLSSCQIPEGFSEANNIMKAVNLMAGITIMERSPTRIGARMGRPEKADIRQMKPPVHGLYPVGNEAGSQRLLKKTFSTTVGVNSPPRECPDCHKVIPFLHCPDCMTETMRRSSSENGRDFMQLNTKDDAERAARMIGFTSVDMLPDMKGVKGLISKEKIPERLEKGLLRAKHEVFVFRDGTIRYDMTDITLTHFRPLEIGADVDRLRELGYQKDIDGKELVSGEQILELKVQDIVINEKGGDYLLKITKFVDDELEFIYGDNRYYKAEKKEDLIGTLAIGLAPHTSGGVLCRIIGFTKALGCLGHPYYHASKRRNCDGDEDAIMLLMDGLLNFSRKFLPEKRGGQMDAPLVLSMRLDPMEVDKEAHNVDVAPRYPIDFFRATIKGARVNDYWMYRMDTIKMRLKTPMQYEGFKFSHNTGDINTAPIVSAYKTIGITEEKINKQLELAGRIRAVDEDDVAERVLTTHLLPDLIGNLRSYSQQSFRCTRCGTKYRRLTLTGRCNKILMSPKPHKCNNKLILTVAEGSVKKYLGIAQSISQKYEVSNYLKQRIDIMSRSIEAMFPSRFKETTLEAFM